MTTCGTLRNLLSISTHARAHLVTRNSRTCDFTYRENVPQRSARTALCNWRSGTPWSPTFARAAMVAGLATTIPTRRPSRHVATRPGLPQWHCQGGRVAKRYCTTQRAIPGRMGPTWRNSSVDGRGNGRGIKHSLFWWSELLNGVLRHED